ncbi:hypothetical protein ACIA8G_05960 [Lentzea sp. NPDC051213]|uniref:hypothetical protein n=1 Tax=Lentzea sp. NPDC051213 TaxID=3364126 RepID=UPI0037BBE9D0
MRIEVSAVGTGGVVSFRCSAGAGAGVWKSAEPPVAGREYDVEVDVDDDVRPRPGGVAGMRIDGTSVVLGGLWQAWWTPISKGAPSTGRRRNRVRDGGSGHRRTASGTSRPVDLHSLDDALNGFRRFALGQAE